jgi:hypothetical protein
MARCDLGLFDLVFIGSTGPKHGDSRGSRQTSFSSSSLFPLTSGEISVEPVTFPPGLARLATCPPPTRSPALPTTIGVVVVAFLATAVVPPPTTMTSTLRFTSSAANSGRRSSFPSAYDIQKRYFSPLRSQVLVDLDARLRYDQRIEPVCHFEERLCAGYSLPVAPRQNRRAQGAWR